MGFPVAAATEVDALRAAQAEAEMAAGTARVEMRRCVTVLPGASPHRFAALRGSFADSSKTVSLRLAGLPSLPPF
jgi:hypothetical protein